MSRERTKEDRPRRLRGVTLREGESVVLVGHPSLATVWPKYVLTLGLYGLWRKRNVSVLTDRRIVTAKGIFSRTERSTAMNHIDGATYVRNGLSAYCVLDATVRGRHELQRVGPLAAKKAKRFTNEIAARS